MVVCFSTPPTAKMKDNLIHLCFLHLMSCGFIILHQLCKTRLSYVETNMSCGKNVTTIKNDLGSIGWNGLKVLSHIQIVLLSL